MPHAETPKPSNLIQVKKDRIEVVSAKVWLVQSISLSRLIAALLFASLAFQNIPVCLLVCIYGFAMFSDLVDGFLARRLNTESFTGKVIDLVSDKSLTIVSILYAAERGISFLPLAVIATREIIVIGLRSITIDGTQLLPTSRIFGGVMALLLWSNTLFLVVVPKNDNGIQTANYVYWGCALAFMVNLAVRIYASRYRIIASLARDG